MKYNVETVCKRAAFILCKKMFTAPCLITYVLLALSMQTFAQGIWTPLLNQAPDNSGGLMFLLSDGTVMAKSAAGDFEGVGNVWNKLTPDASGSYANGTWSPIAPMNFTRLYFSTQILKDGRVYVAGGEYGTGGSFGEIYDPTTDTWAIIPDSVSGMYDANSEMLPNGEVLQAIVDDFSDSTVIYDPLTNTYRSGPACVGIHDEAAWLKLPDNSILFNDLLSNTSERYIPSLNRWVAEDTLPAMLYSYIGETGPSFLLPDGRAIFLGGNGHNVFYTPSGNNNSGIWTAAPDFPNGTGMPDAAAAMMANGKILCAVSPPGDSIDNFPIPVSFYEFDYTTNSFTQITGPYGNDQIMEPAYVTNMLDLPDGSVLYCEQGSTDYFVYTPAGTPVISGKPTIANINRTSCNTFTITGTLFNGISEGAAFGDDWQMATNFPIIQLSAGGLVYYARSFNWNSRGVQRGNKPDTAMFTLPAGITSGTYSLVVIANGIASDPVSFTPPYTGLTSTLTPPAICSNTVFNYVAVSDSAGAVFTWTRPAVTGISNPAITAPQSANPSETLINNTPNPVAVVYNYVSSISGCSPVQQVTVMVNPLPAVVISGPDTICAGQSVSLVASGGYSYVWSDSYLTDTAIEQPAISTTYSVTATNIYTCTQSASKYVDVKQCTGIAAMGNKPNNIMSLQPNPAASETEITFSTEEAGNYDIILFDIFGRAVLHQSKMAVSGNNTQPIYLNGIEKGVYLVVVQKNNVYLKNRLVVQ